MVAEESKFLPLEKGSLSHSYESLAEKVKTLEMEVTADEWLEQWNFTLSRKKLAELNYKIDMMTEYWRLEGYLP